MVVQENLRTDLVSSPLKNDKKHRLKQRFDVMRKLGQGTYGKVQLAINRETGQEVAVKTIKKAKVETEKDLVRIRREIQIMSSIQHPHIIHIYEVFENKDKIVLVMQYARGGELFNYLMEKKVLSDLEARRIFRQIAAAIYYCHKNKICHRDLKLENVLLDEKGNAKIVDFGLSNVFDEKHLLDTYCGSPLYASPEIVKGVPYYGPEVDCWSMGVVLYTLVYGAMPFDGSDFGKLVSQIHEANYFEPKKKSSASELIRRLLTVNPAKRATIVDVCMDYWVNLGYEHSLLQVAEDMANLTPVRLDLLLALAPESSVPPDQSEISDAFDDSEEVMLKANLNKDIPNEEDEEEEEEDEEYNPDTAANSFSFMKGSHASQLSVSSPNLQDAFSDECEDSESEFLPADIAAALQGECAKRLAESSFGSSLARVSSLAHQSKKPKKSNSSKVDLSEESSDKEAKRGNEEVGKKNAENLKTSSGKLSVSNSKSSKNSRTSLVEKSSSSSSDKIKVESSGNNIAHNRSSNITQTESVEVNRKNNSKESSDKDQLVKDQKNSSLEKVKEASEKGRKESLPTQDEKVENKKLWRPPGKIIIPKTFDSPQSSPSPKPVTVKKVVKAEKEPDVKQPNSSADSKSAEKAANSTPEDINKNFIISNSNKDMIHDVGKKSCGKKEEVEAEKPSVESKSEVQNVEDAKSAAITEEQKNIAKGILKKGIAKAKLAERRMSKQNSQDSEVSSTCSTPVSAVGTPDPKPSFFKAPKPYAKEGDNCIESKAEIKLSSNKNSSSTLKNEVASNQTAPLWENALHSSERSVQEKSSNWSSVSPTIDSELGGWKEQMEESLRRLSPDDDRLSSSSSYTATKSEDDKPLVPIARSYKKFTFTKDGACITETKKIYTTPGVDGSWTKVEKKTKITTRPGNAEEFEKFRDMHLRTSSPLTRSDSQSSSGSNEVYDDIFDSWTGDTMMCNMRKMSNMFNKFSRDPFLKKERRRNPFRFFRRTESERSERDKRRYEVRSGRPSDRESSENEDYDVHYDDSSAVVYGSQGLWQLLRSTNQGFPGRVTIRPEPVSYGRSVSQDRSDANWKRSGSRASSGYNTVTRSQSRDRTESPREKVLRFVLESPRDGFSRESTVGESPARHEKWSLKKNMSRHNPRRDSGVGSDGYESEYSIRQSPSDELSKAGRVSSMSSICSGSRQDMIRNFMKSWSREFISPPTSPTSLRNTKEQFENLPENRKNRVEQWLHMNSDPPFDFYTDSLPGVNSRKSSTSHSNSSSAYATMRPREYFHYNRSSSDKIANCDSDRFPSFEEHRTRSHSLKQDTSSSEMNKIRFRTATYSPVSEESSKEMHCASDSSGSSVHRINFTISDGRIASSHTTSPPTGGRYSRQFSTSKEGSVTYGSPPPTSIKFEQTSTRIPVQPVVQMRVSFNRGGSRENNVIQVTSQSSPPSKGLWDQQDSDKDSSQDCGLARNPSPLPGIRQFSTEVQHSVGSSEKTSRASIDLVRSGKESPNAHTG
ncbi:probable serine/threonine-protein kinase nek3 [Uloborus diversus]|uniref:probable serine/threonine-protein kinase nek3 n=1 Tax=Uloborus diversus TaxID=327109 RepID=UPI00240A3EFA|nr:probable serine/threonine-protein kinase nek3 [Uloborus diversus]